MKKIKNILLLQGVVIIYSISSVMSKLASGQKDDMLKFFLYFGLEIVFLGLYAVFWQQMIKRFDLTVAYANRAMVILWSLIWAVIFFKDSITVQNICGIVLVIVGTILVNVENTKEESADE